MLGCLQEPVSKTRRCKYWLKLWRRWRIQPTVASHRRCASRKAAQVVFQARCPCGEAVCMLVTKFFSSQCSFLKVSCTVLQGGTSHAAAMCNKMDQKCQVKQATTGTCVITVAKRETACSDFECTRIRSSAASRATIWCHGPSSTGTCPSALGISTTSRSTTTRRTPNPRRPLARTAW